MWCCLSLPPHPQILGFDILLMKTLKPVLLEVNANPSMKIEHEKEVSPLLPPHCSGGAGGALGGLSSPSCPSQCAHVGPPH